MKSIKPISTKVEKTIEISEERIVVLEDYYGFEGISNIYCIENDCIIWFAEKSQLNDIFVNMIKSDVESIYAFTWNGYRVEINTQTGIILDVIFTKQGVFAPIFAEQYKYVYD